jgi:AcrR family transcriptional regulator
MISSARIVPPPRTRRSHSERTADTRARVMDAVVECINEIGFHRTTGSEIARRAGVTWGAIQHQFRDKDGILIAVLDRSYQRFAQDLGTPPEDATTIEQRVEVFIDRAWAHFAGPEYRATYEILLNLPADLDDSWIDHMIGDWERIWAEFFPSGAASKRFVGELMQYTFAVLSGLAGSQMLQTRGSRVRAVGLRLLKQTLIRELGEHA